MRDVMNNRMTDSGKSKYKDKRDISNKPGQNSDWYKSPQEEMVDSLTKDKE